MTAAELADRLAARPSGSGWTARCPAHDNHNPSLSIAQGDDGKVLLYCQAGRPFRSSLRSREKEPRKGISPDLQQFSTFQKLLGRLHAGNNFHLSTPVATGAHIVRVMREFKARPI